MSALQSLSSFSHRPDFPKGLKVMVVDPDSDSLKSTTEQLRECNYEVSSCSNEVDANKLLSDKDGAFDVLLCQTSVVSRQTSSLTAFLEKIRDLPLVLFGENCTQGQKMTAVKELGAVDVLEKPLSLLKLRNLWQHSVRKMLRAQKQSGRGNSIVKDETCEVNQNADSAPAANCAGVPSVGVTTRLHRARQQESTGSSEAIETSADVGKDSTADELMQSRAVGTRKAESWRKTAAATPPPAAKQQQTQPPQQQQQLHQPQPSMPPVAQAPMNQQYYMQGMPAPLPGCVWGLPMLPPPVPGMIGATMPWPSPMHFNMQQQAQMQQAVAVAGGKAPTMVMSASSATASSQTPMYPVQPCWHPAVMPGATLQPQPLPARAPQQSVSQSTSQLVPNTCVKVEANSAQHTSTTGSNSNSEATWQVLDWGMDDILFDDPDNPTDPKLDLNNILGNGLVDLDNDVQGGVDTAHTEVRESKDGFDLALNDPCETWLDEHSMLEDDFDASLAGLNYNFEGPEYNDELGLTLNKSPSLIDMIDHLCANEPAA